MIFHPHEQRRRNRPRISPRRQHVVRRRQKPACRRREGRARRRSGRDFPRARARISTRRGPISLRARRRRKRVEPPLQIPIHDRLRVFVKPHVINLHLRRRRQQRAVAHRRNRPRPSRARVVHLAAQNQELRPLRHRRIARIAHRPAQHAIDVKLLLRRRPLQPIDVIRTAQPEARRRVADAFVRRAVAVPMNVPDNLPINIRPRAIHESVLANINLRPRRLRVADGIAHRRRLHPKRRPHPRRIVVFNPRLNVAVSRRQLRIRGNHPRVMRAAARVGRNRRHPAAHAHRRRRIHRIAPRPREPVNPLRRIERRPVELIIPKQRPAISRRHHRPRVAPEREQAKNECEKAHGQRVHTSLSRCH